MEIEKELGDKDLIVSYTDKNGVITYSNRTFSTISEFSKKELYGQPHNIIRHPDMPKSVFKYVWKRLSSGKAVVAYVKNYVKGEKQFYWVKAVLYPKIENNEIVLYTSYRTKATRFEISQVSEIYKLLVEYERNHTIDEALNYFVKFLDDRNLTYSKMVNRLNDGQQILNQALMNLDISKFKTDHMIFRSRIESLVEKGYQNIEVAKPTCCNFGKRLAELENENFAKGSKFKEIKRLHAKVHDELQLFADSKSPAQRDVQMNGVYKDIDELFVIMDALKNENSHDTNIDSLRG